MHTLSLSLDEMPQNARIAIYGTGKRGNDYLKIISTLRPDVKVVCFIDSYGENLQNTPPIIKVDNVLSTKLNITIILICSFFYDEIYRTLDKSGVLSSKEVVIFRTYWFDELLSSNEIVACEQSFSKIIVKLPNELFVYEALGHLALQQNDYESALQHFIQAECRFPDNINGYLGRANMLLQMNKYVDAENLYKYLENTFSENIHGYLGRANVLVQMNKYEDAETLYEFIEVKFPNNIDGYLGHASVFVRMNKYEDAEKLYMYLENKFPDNINGYLGYANMLLQLNKYVDAEKLYKYLENTFSENIHGYLGRANVLVQMNKYEDAEALYEFIELKFPNNIDGYLGHASVLMRMNKYEDAEKLYIYLKNKFSDNIHGYIGCANILERMNKYEDAEKLYINLENKFPDNINGYLGHAHVFVRMNKYDDAEKIYIYLEDKFPNDMRGYRGHAHVLMQMNKYEEADTLYKHLEGMFYYDANVYCEHVQNLLVLKKFDEAEQVLLAADKINHNSLQLVSLRKQVFISLDKYQFARKMHSILINAVAKSQPKSHTKTLKILFNHIPKCAGTSISTYLKTNYINQKIFYLTDPFPSYVAYFLSLTNEEKEDYDLILGHNAHALIPFISHDMLKITVLREPIERIVSDYYFFLRHPYFKSSANNVTLYNYINTVQNFYIDYFTTVEERQQFSGIDLVNKCYSNIKQTYDLIGTTDKLGEFAAKLQKIARLPLSYIEKKENATYGRKRIDEIETSVIDLAKKRLALDIHLYNLITRDLA